VWQQIYFFMCIFPDLKIYMDMSKAMAAGLRFFRSANNVILSPGDSNGIIQPEFFSKVKNVKTNQIIFSAENQNWKVPDVKIVIHVSSIFVISYC